MSILVGVLPSGTDTVMLCWRHSATSHITGGRVLARLDSSGMTRPKYIGSYNDTALEAAGHPLVFNYQRQVKCSPASEHPAYRDWDTTRAVRSARVPRTPYFLSGDTVYLKWFLTQGRTELCACDSSGAPYPQSSLLVFDSGQLWLWPYVDPDFGFPLDPAGQLRLAD